MRVKWSNIVALSLMTMIVIVLLANLESVLETLASLRHIGPSESPEERTFGLVVLGLLLVSIVAVVKIVIHGGNKQP